MEIMIKINAMAIHKVKVPGRKGRKSVEALHKHIPTPDVTWLSDAEARRIVRRHLGKAYQIKAVTIINVVGGPIISDDDSLRYAVGLLTERIGVETTFAPGPCDVPLSFAPGMVGALPVFSTLDAALDHIGASPNRKRAVVYAITPLKQRGKV